MNTNQIKSFAQKARIILLTGVEARLRFWSFQTSGGHTQAPEAVTGGYTYAGQVYDDPTVPSKWRQIADRSTTAQAYADIKEDAAYTWFNRLMVVRILEANGHIPPTLSFVPGTHTPTILQQAKLGQQQLTTTALKSKLTTFLTEHQDEQALSLLLMHTFNTMPVLRTIFGDVSAYMDLLLPTNILAADGLLALINDPNAIDPATYHEVELIGWLYQFYIADKKDEVFAGFKANKKARAEDIPAATQIFTPKWIVRYMVENTLGKLYLDMEPTSTLEQGMKYLVKSPSHESESVVSPITSMTNLTIIDPASGSGHILVVGFELLLDMYLEQGYTRKAAVISILQHNLYGLDIDDRAAQLARLAVLLKAAQYYPDILQETDLTTIHIHAFPAPQHFTVDEITGFVGVDRTDISDALQKALDLLYHGKNIGSALQLNLTSEQRTIIVEQYAQWSEDAASGKLDAFAGLFWQRLRPYLDVLMILTRQYTAVVANPPYMGSGNMNATLKAYVNAKYPKSKSDLFAVFIESMIDMTLPDCRMGCITMESWMFLSSYENLRLSILDNYSIVSLAHFGWHIIGIAFGTATLILEKSKKIDLGEYSYLTIDEINRELNEPYSFPVKENKRFAIIPQSNFSKIPGSPIAYWASENIIKAFENKNLFHVSEPRLGMATADNSLFTRYFWEIDQSKFYTKCESREHAKKSLFKWFPYAKGGDFRKWYGNINLLVEWKNDGKEIRNFTDINGKVRSHNYNLDFIFNKGITWNALSSGSTSFRIIENSLFDNAGSSLFPNSLHNLHYLLGLLNTKVVQFMLPFVNPTLNYQPGTIGKIPYIKTKNENTLTLNALEISKRDWNSYEKSWDFEQSPLINSTSTLAIAYQKWHEQVTEDFFQLHANEEELNRIFIDIYGLQDELTPEVALRDITILQDELDSKDLDAIEPLFRVQGKDAVTLPIKREIVMSQFISYCIGIMMGRYRLDQLGLHIAHPSPSQEELAAYTYHDHTIQIDEDAIIPLMGDDGAFTDDALVRLRHLLTAIWGEDTLTENINLLQDGLNTSLHRWLTEQFWPYHCSMYKKKPIYWLFASDTKKPAKAAFRVLVYMHRMDRFTIQTIRNKYLHPHQEYLQHQHDTLQRNESSLTTHEIKKMETISRQIIECRQYDDTLKHLANQQITFDLDDGVDRNIALFDTIVATIK
jgi:hypothetical protein